MRKLFALVLAVMILAGCRTDSKYKVNASLEMKITRTSCGFVEASFETDRDAYYFIDIEEVREGVDPFAMAEQFCTLALDHAYMEYINWRYELLLKGGKHIAEFSSHSLQYGRLDYFFTGLDANKDYWVFGFVVDPYTNSPVGDLVLETVRTDAVSKLKVNFKYRVNDTWDYIYPLDESGQLDYVFPWIGETVDSLVLRDVLKVQSPGRYFSERFSQLYESGTANIFHGMYAHNNNGEGDGTSNTLFEEGHTYYTALASFDGPLVMDDEKRNWRIYKISRWHPRMKKSYTSADDTLGGW